MDDMYVSCCCFCRWVENFGFGIVFCNLVSIVICWFSEDWLLDWFLVYWWWSLLCCWCCWCLCSVWWLDMGILGVCVLCCCLCWWLMWWFGLVLCLFWFMLLVVIGCWICLVFVYCCSVWCLGIGRSVWSGWFLCCLCSVLLFCSMWCLNVVRCVGFLGCVIVVVCCCVWWIGLG